MCLMTLLAGKTWKTDQNKQAIFFWPVIAWLRNLHADFVVCLLGYWLTANFNLHPLIHKTLNKNIQLNAILPGSIFELSHEAHWYRL